MMPLQNRPPVPPTQATPPTPELLVSASASGDEILPPHADYNLHPLRVQSLDHYVIVDDKGERFYVR